MGGIAGMLGLGGGAAGTGFGGAANAAISSPTTPEQIEAARKAAQAGMTGQQNLLTALQSQNGLQNQEQVYNQLQGVANGTGPNPALAQLNQSTANNAAQQGALMASQRGISANPGMMARQAAMQGGNLQQQAAGQAATLAAQQQLGAIGQAGGMASNMAANQIAQTNANTQAQQAEQAQLLGAQGNYNNAAVGSQSSVNAANAGLAGKQMGAQQGMLSGIMGGAGSALGMFGGSGTPAMATGGMDSLLGGAGGTVMAGGAGDAIAANPELLALAAEGGQVPKVGGPSSYFGKRMLAKGGPVPALVSPGEKYLPPQAVAQVKQGANPMKVGETIPGKPKVEGAKNSYANDTVPKTLQEGGIVLPRSVTQSKDPSAAAAKFVAAIMKKDAMKRKS